MSDLQESAATREWTDVGRDFHDTAAAEWASTRETFESRVEAAAAELTWQAPAAGVITGPMSPVQMLKEVIGQLDLRPITGYAYGGCLYYPDGPEHATYSLLGVEVTTRTQKFRVVLLDTGLGATPLFIDWYIQ